MNADQDSDPNDLPAVSNPQLRVLVELARSQPLPIHRRDPEALHAAFLAARQVRRRRLGTYVSLACAAALAAFALTRLDHGLSLETVRSAPVAAATHAEPGAAALDPGAASAATPTLTAAARVLAAAADTPAPTVLGSWEVALAPGRYTVELEPHPGPEVLLLRVPGGSLELQHGRVVMVVGAMHTEAALQHGVGVWVADDGRREALSSDEASLPADAPPTAASEAAPAPEVSALARRAEDLLRAGKRAAAIRQLSQIVTQHPQHPAARAALLDLAPLLGAAGRVDEARCAYRLYLERYPGKAQLADQVEKALSRLGDGGRCRGLKPS